MAKTIDEGFAGLRSNLEITDLQEKTVSTRQQNVRKALEDDFDILDSFLTGSYRRSTMIAPLKGADLDIFIVLDPKYYEASARPDEELSSPVSRRVIEREARGQRYVLVTEPARDGGKVVTERKGIGVFVIRTRGRPAHAGGDPDKGRNAIVAMAEIVLAINGLNDPRRGITTNVGLIAGGTARNTVAEECMIEVDLRFCDPANASELEAKLKALKSSRPDIETTVTGKITRPPFVRGRGVDLVFDKAATIAKEIGFDLERAPRVGGGSDGNFTVAMGIPTLDGLGVDGDGAHTNHEYMLFSSIKPRTRLLQGLMEQLE